MKYLFKILFLSLLVSFCFSDVISYKGEGGGSYIKGRWTPGEQIKTITNVEILYTQNGVIYYSQTSRGYKLLNKGGGLILLSGLLNLYMINSSDYNKIKMISNFSNLFLSVGGFMILYGDRDDTNNVKSIDCREVISITDDSGNPLTFDCP